MFCCSMTSDSSNPLVLEVLPASSTAYSFNPDEPIDEVSGVLSSDLSSDPFIHIVLQDHYLTDIGSSL